MNPQAEKLDRGLALDQRVRVVAILTLPVSKLLRSKIHENIKNSASESRFIDELNELDRMSFFPASYAKWLKVNGVQVVPLDIFAPLDEQAEILRAADGLLLTGGAVPLYKPETLIELDPGVSSIVRVREFSFYTRKVRELTRLAKQINKDGRVFPVWTTCLGFEGLILGEANLTIGLSNVGNANFPSSVRLLDRENELIKFFAASEAAAMERENLFYFNHEHAFFVSQFAENEQLQKKYEVVAEAFSREDTDRSSPIVAIIASRRYPIYGVQFHPEKNQFESKVAVDRSPATLSLLGKFSQFFCDKLAGSSPSSLDFLSQKLTEYNLYVGTDIGVFDEVYIFQKNN